VTRPAQAAIEGGFSAGQSTFAVAGEPGGHHAARGHGLRHGILQPRERTGANRSEPERASYPAVPPGYARTRVGRCDKPDLAPVACYGLGLAADGPRARQGGQGKLTELSALLGGDEAGEDRS